MESKSGCRLLIIYGKNEKQYEISVGGLDLKIGAKIIEALDL